MAKKLIYIKLIQLVNMGSAFQFHMGRSVVFHLPVPVLRLKLQFACPYPVWFQFPYGQLEQLDVEIVMCFLWHCCNSFSLRGASSCGNDSSWCIPASVSCLTTVQVVWQVLCDNVQVPVHLCLPNCQTKVYFLLYVWLNEIFQSTILWFRLSLRWSSPLWKHLLQQLHELFSQAFYFLELVHRDVFLTT